MAVLGACVPFARGLSLTHIFYIRDLTMFFWPRHLWMHRSLLSGSWPLWDPYASAGQPVFPDALNQLFLLPVLILRLIPAVPGFNLIVAAPFPLAALGMWLFLRRSRLRRERRARRDRVRRQWSGCLHGKFPQPLVVGRLDSVDLLGRRSRS